MHRCNVRIDLLRYGQETADGRGLLQNCLVRFIERLVGTGIHTVEFQQSQLRFEFTDLGRANKR